MYPPIEELKLKLKFPVSSMSLMMVSVVTFPSSLTKKSCSITEAETVRREGSLRRSFPNLVGWLGYWVRQYSSRAHWDFSCSCSTTEESVRPIASEIFSLTHSRRIIISMTGIYWFKNLKIFLYIIHNNLSISSEILFSLTYAFWHIKLSHTHIYIYKTMEYLIITNLW